MDEHDYYDTLYDAKDLDEGHDEERKRRDSELAFEALAAASSMGLFGSDQQVTELIRLELAQQLSRRLSLNPPEDEE